MRGKLPQDEWRVRRGFLQRFHYPAGLTLTEVTRLLDYVTRGPARGVAGTLRWSPTNTDEGRRVAVHQRIRCDISSAQHRVNQQETHSAGPNRSQPSGELRLISKSRQRDRTPTYDELKRLDSYFEVQDCRSDIPMRDIMWFSIYSSRRESETTRLLWEDNDNERQLGLVGDAKHPTAKEGNHRRFRYTREAWEIAQRQPKTSADGRIFPYNAKSICARFTRACHVLNIVDLHFHDLRHEATTRLFEQGLGIPEVSAHTLHESWAVLKRYTHLVRRVKLFHAPFLKHSETSPTRAERR